MSSADVLVRVGAGAWGPPTDGVDAGSGTTISVKLEDTTGVNQWWLVVSGTDELTSPPTLVGTSMIGEVIPVSGIVTFVMPSAEGRAVRLTSTTRVGVNTYEERFAVYTLTGASRRVGAFGETLEGAAADGWTGKVNKKLREVPRQETLTAENITTDQALAAELSQTPVTSSSVRLYLNGLLQEQGTGKDYRVVGKQIIWLAATGTAVDMEVSDKVVVTYLGVL